MKRRIGCWILTIAMLLTLLPAGAAPAWGDGETYTVTFNANGGSGTMSQQSFASGVAQGLKQNTFKRTGYSFTGWNTDQNGAGTAYSDQQSITLTTSITLYAQWSANTYRVVLNMNDGTGTTTEITVTYAADMPSTTMPSRLGYTFLGYFDSLSGGTQYYDANGQSARSWNKDQNNAILYARWSANTYQVLFNANGGTALTDADRTVTYGDVYGTLPKPTNSDSTKRFTGWYTADAGGRKIEESTVVTTTEDQTLYAHWETITHTVKFDVNNPGCSNTFNDQTVVHGGKATYPVTKPYAPGYKFEGWTYQGVTYTNQTELDELIFNMDDSVITFVAKWTAEPFTVTFLNKRNGSVYREVEVDYNHTVTAPDPPPADDGYRFAGWYYDGNPWDFNRLITEDGIKIYAEWEDLDYTVTFMNGETNLGEQTVKKGAKIKTNDKGQVLNDKTKAIIPSKAGYTFRYWATKNSDGTYTEWNLNTQTVSNKTTLYAVWKVNEYLITFNTNRGTWQGATGEDSKRYEYGSKITKPTDPVRTGYTFGGWYRDSAFSTAWNFDEDTVPVNGVTLYARWVHTVKFFDSENGEEFEELRQTVADNGLISVNKPEKPGYAFVAWYKERDLKNVWNATDKVTTDLNLYAKWEAVQYTVTFELNGGEWKDTAVSQTQNIGYNGKATEPTEPPTKTGYVFVAWYQDSSFKNVYNFDEIVSGNVTLYAKWALDGYAITYHANDGTSTSKTIPVPLTKEEAKAGQIEVTLATLASLEFTVRQGYTFKGWNTAEKRNSAAAPEYADQAKITLKGNLDLYAKWEKTGVVVTFDANGGTETMDPQTVPKGTATKLSKNLFQREGYGFIGWSTKKSANGKPEYTDEAEVKLDQDVTLYAQWDRTGFTVTFDANASDGVTGTMEKQTFKKADGKQALTKNQFVRTGCTFSGWNTSEDGFGRAYADEQELTPGEDLNTDLYLFAQWTKNVYTVTYELNDGIWTDKKLSKEQKVDYDSYLAKPVIPTKPGLVFDGWFTNKELTDEWDFAVDRVRGDVTLYAKWSQRDLLVTFDANGGYGSMGDVQRFKVDKEDKLRANAFARMYCTFLRWNTKPDGSGTDYENEQSIKPVEDLTLYAIWGPCVTYYGNNNDEEKDTLTKFVQTIVTTGSTTISENRYTRKGYTFKCWNTKADGTGTNYTPKQAEKLSESMELYAVWTPIKFSVRFNANGGIGTMQDQVFEYDKEQALTANVYTRAGRTFQGWSLGAGGEIKYKDKDSVKNLSDQDGKLIMLYAVWDVPGASGSGAIRIQQGNNIIASMTPKEGDPYVFNVSAGVYNVVVTSGGKTVTTMVETTGGEVKGPSAIPPEAASSVLELKGGAPNVVVGNLDTAADDNRVLGSTAELKLTVEGKEENTSDAQQNAIRALCPDGKALEFLDLTLTKSVNGTKDGTFSGESRENLILRIPFTKAATKDITVYRWHNGKVDTLTTRAQDGEYIKVENDAVTLYARKFSTYAICYTPKDPSMTYLNCPRNQVCPLHGFDDASTMSWYHDGVHWAMDAGAMKGVTARRFYPNSPTSRAQLVTILWRLEGSPRMGQSAPFEDVPEGSWYAEAVAWASLRGIVTGQSAREFNPNGDLTREQMATILYRYIQQRGRGGEELVGLGGFSDAGSVSKWAREGMDWLTTFGILEGAAGANGTRLLDPKGSATRAQVATVMMRYWEGFVS